MTRLKVGGVVAVVALVAVIVWLIFPKQPATVDDGPSPQSNVEIGRRSSGTRSAPVPTGFVKPPEMEAAETNSVSQNAADLYREAFAALEALSKEEKGLLTDWRTNAVAPELCAKLEPIAALTHQATTNCDWGIKFEGFSTLLPHLSQSRQLARALVWNAAHCRQTDTAGVGADLLAALRLGQNSSEFLIGHLLNTAIQGMALDYLAENARSLPAATLAELVGALSDSAYDESFYRAMEFEAKGVEFEADRFAASTNDIRNLIQAFGDDGRLASLSNEQVVAQMRAVAALEREYVQAIGLSAADYQTWLTKLQTARQSNPLLDALMPAFDATLEKTRGAVVQHAMAVAGLQVLVAGPAVLSQHLDPASGTPFQYQVTSTGFTLTSSFQRNGKPVSVNFRQ